MRKWIVAGGRDFVDDEMLTKELENMISMDDGVISGGARGADTLAYDWAGESGRKRKMIPADWDKHGKAAGAIRNQQMAQIGDALIAFWDGKSRGT